MACVLEIRSLTAGYADLPVVHGFSTKLVAGTITTLIGGNGAGKSTLMRALYGTCRIFSGEIIFNGASIEHMAPWERLARGIGFVPQGRCNFSTMRVDENLKMACYSLRRAAHAEAVGRTLALFPALQPKLNVMAGNLSGGEQQMLEMAMVMALAPKLLLLDEPSLGLSPKMQQDVFAMARQVASTGVTVLMVEQNAHGALRASDQAIVLELGRNVLEGPAATVIHDPRIRQAYLGERTKEHAA
ncbi:MAG: ABC transporter ATP-binding protein [Burkholderiales bacterium]